MQIGGLQNFSSFWVIMGRYGSWFIWLIPCFSKTGIYCFDSDFVYHPVQRIIRGLKNKFGN